MLTSLIGTITQTNMLNTTTTEQNQEPICITAKCTIQQLANRLNPEDPDRLTIGTPGSSSRIILKENRDASSPVSFPSGQFWDEVCRLRIRKLIFEGPPGCWEGLRPPPRGMVFPFLESFSAPYLQLPACFWEEFSEHFPSLRSIEVSEVGQEEIERMNLPSIRSLRDVTINIGQFHSYTEIGRAHV